MTEAARNRHGDTWLRVHHPSPTAGLRLVCFPHAGGAASSYLPLSAALRPEIEVLAVQYPGRHDRHRESPMTHVGLLAASITAALGQWTDRPFAFFGHSYGALVAFEVVRRLERDPAAARPTALFVSGRRAPSTYRDERLHLEPDHRLVAELRKHGGTDPSLLEDADVLDMILPTLRADYRAVETYRYTEGPALDVPITALVGDADHRTTLREAAAWSDHAGAGFDLRVFPGGHFYLIDELGAVVALLRERLDPRH